MLNRDRDLSILIALESPKASDVVRFIEILARQNHISGIVQRAEAYRRQTEIKKDLSILIALESLSASDVVRFIEILARQNYISGIVQRGLRSARLGLN